MEIYDNLMDEFDESKDKAEGAGKTGKDIYDYVGGLSESDSTAGTAAKAAAGSGNSAAAETTSAGSAAASGGGKAAGAAANTGAGAGAAAESATAAATTASAAATGAAGGSSAATSTAASAAAGGPVGWVVGAVIALLANKKIRNGLFVIILVATMLPLVFLSLGVGLTTMVFDDEKMKSSDETVFQTQYELLHEAIERGVTAAFAKVQQKIIDEAIRGGYDVDLTLANTQYDGSHTLMYDPYWLMAIYSVFHNQEATFEDGLRDLEKSLAEADLWEYEKVEMSEMVTKPYQDPTAAWGNPNAFDEQGRIKVYDEEKEFQMPLTDAFGNQIYDREGNALFTTVKAGTPVRTKYLKGAITGFKHEEAEKSLGAKKEDWDKFYDKPINVLGSNIFEQALSWLVSPGDVKKAYKEKYGKDYVMDVPSHGTFFTKVYEIATATEQGLYNTTNGIENDDYITGNGNRTFYDMHNVSDIRDGIMALYEVISKIEINNKDVKADIESLLREEKYDFTSYLAPFNQYAHDMYYPEIEALNEIVSEWSDYDSENSFSIEMSTMKRIEDFCLKFYDSTTRLDLKEGEKAEIYENCRKVLRGMRDNRVTLQFTIDGEGNVVSTTGGATGSNTPGGAAMNDEFMSRYLAELESSEGGVIRKKILAVAAKYEQMYTEYKWGGKSLPGLDCSGFTALVMREVFGDKMPFGGASYEQAKWCSARNAFFTDKSMLQPGDLIFYRLSSRNDDKAFKVTHIAIYVGSIEHNLKFSGKPQYVHSGTGSITKFYGEIGRNRPKGGVGYTPFTYNERDIVGFGSPTSVYLEKYGAIKPEDFALTEAYNAKADVPDKIKSMDKNKVLTPTDKFDGEPLAQREMKYYYYCSCEKCRKKGSGTNTKRKTGTVALSRDALVDIGEKAGRGELDSGWRTNIDPAKTVVEIDGVLYRVEEYAEGPHKADANYIGIYTDDHEKAITNNYYEEGKKTKQVTFYTYGIDKSEKNYKDATASCGST